jgi:hypothetical protein
LFKAYETTDKEAFVDYAKQLRSMLQHGSKEAMIRIMTL